MTSNIFVRNSIESDHYGRCEMPENLLNQTRSHHLSYLVPIFAEKNRITQGFYPLRSNVPTHQLLSNEFIRRSSATSNTITRHIDPKWIDSSDEIERRLAHYAQQWNIDPAIIVANLNRVINIIPRLTLYSFVWRMQEERGFEIKTKEWYWALEFYMQMDIDCFFMKTCSFYPIIPRHNQEHIFAIQAPDARFGMKRCRDQDCRFCYERIDLSHRSEPAMIFSPQQVHRFVSGYWVYLNADVVRIIRMTNNRLFLKNIDSFQTCQTSHVLYALTCPCHQFDYLGRCKQSFRDRMREHRMEACRQMRNFFLGQSVMEQLQHDEPMDPVMLSSHRHLAEHSAHCTTALNMFLRCQPKYWCFVPMTYMDADLADAQFENSTDQFDCTTSSSPNTTPIISPYERSADSINWCIDHLPTPPAHYRFTKRQRIEQYDFFLNRFEMFPTRFLDMYNATIVVALPNPCSDEIRHLIHALFVAFTQPKLNVMASSNGTAISLTVSDQPWCANLIHPCRSSS